MDAGKIKEQLEFYFSNSNYAKDKFLQETAIKNNKCIPISTILTFQRMKQLGATVEGVKDALAGSEVIEIVGESLKKIETKEYLEYRADKDIGKRVVHMKGFDTNASLDDLKAVLDKHCAPVKILMRRDKEKQFKGSCFVEFGTAAEAEDALSLKIEAPQATGSEKENADADGPSKRAKKEPAFVEVTPKEVYLQNRPDTKDAKNERFADKVRADFIPKLFKYEAGGDLSIAEIKELVKNVAFVDTSKKIVRMKYREEWDEKEFGGDEKKLKLTKMDEKDAREYVDGINIKKIPKNK